MRKLLWCGIAAAVACGVAVCVAADYAARHPESWLGRCVTSTAQLGVRCNPFIAMTTVTSRAASESEEECDADGACGAEALLNKVRVPKPQPRVEDKPILCAGQQAEVVEPIQVEGNHGVVAGEPRCLDRIPEEIIRALVPLPEFENQTEQVEVGGEEQTTEPPIWSIPCIPPLMATKRMPYADEFVPAVEDEDCCADGGCWIWRLIPVIDIIRDIWGLESSSEEETEANEENNEETEAIHRHHHQHECPHMRCPYPYATPRYPVATPEQRPTAEPAQEQKPKPRVRLGWPMSIWKKLFWGGENVPAHQGVDTMDFRPGDAPDYSSDSMSF